MLEIAYKNNEDDPYITDSVGWGYYLTGRYTEAEKFMRKAITLMPNDPIVNDHYGDVLWKLNMKLQASYYWKAALLSNEAEESLKDKINKNPLRILDSKNPEERAIKVTIAPIGAIAIIRYAASFTLHTR